MTTSPRNEAKERIDKLKELINKWNYHYFTKDECIFSEAARDDLKQELIMLETAYPDLITADSPSQKIGSVLSGRLPKVEHLTRKWSLSDMFSFDELQEWEQRLQRYLPNRPWHYFCELKIDGLNISLHYQEGTLVRALTRGNGTIGEDITHSIKTIYGVPLTLSRPLTIEVSGEVYMPRKSLEKLNERLTKKGEELFANPRSAAAGSVRQLDPKVAAERDLGMFVYTLGENSLANPPQTQEETLALMAELGFMISPHTALTKNLDAVQKFYKHIESIRETLAFDIDGIVVKVNEKDIQEAAGFTAKTPRAQVAYKFPALEASTLVEGITIQIGRTGALTPVAELRAVDVAGSTVKRATLHNKKEIERKDIRIGDTVIIHKAGDVIPEVLRVLTELRTGKETIFAFPTHCPICQSPTIEENEGTIVRCSNKQCFAQHREQMIHATSKKAFDIDGMGESVIDELIALDLCTDLTDIFKLTAKDLAQLPLFKEKKINNLIKGIESAKTISLARLLFALGIRHVGEETARDLATLASRKVPQAMVESFEASYPTEHLHPLLAYLEHVTTEELLEVDGFGPEVTNSVIEWFAAQENKELLKKLIQSGVKPQALSLYQVVEQTFFTGKNFVITGTLESMGREQIKELILKGGGHVQGAVSKNTDYLICGADSGSKMKKALSLNIKILSESELKERL